MQIEILLFNYVKFEYIIILLFISGKIQEYLHRIDVYYARQEKNIKVQLHK